MSPIRIGVVGLSKDGWASTSLVPPLLESDKYVLTALSTSSAQSAEDAASHYSKITKHQVKPFHGTSAHIASDPDVDLVAVSVKVPLHKRVALPVIESGKNIFVEWPLGNGGEEARELAAAANRKNVRTMVGLQGWQNPAIKKVSEIISSGKIGRVLSSSLVSSKKGTLAKRIHFRRKEWCVSRSEPSHMTYVPSSCFTLVLGEFASVTATTATLFPSAKIVDASGNPTGLTAANTGVDQVAFSGTLKSGIVASVHYRAGIASKLGADHFLWVINGEEGSIKMENEIPGGAFLGMHTPSIYLDGELVAAAPDYGLDNVGRAWAEFAKGEEGTYPTFEDAVKLHRLVDAISESARDGRTVTL
ncbi:NAD-P-binding protein [Hysterangium stoloniferum]|nr:NAD-P-binding protein [Hysterangium stoloniferum]